MEKFRFIIDAGKRYRLFLSGIVVIIAIIGIGQGIAWYDRYVTHQEELAYQARFHTESFEIRQGETMDSLLTQAGCEESDREQVAKQLQSVADMVWRAGSVVRVVYFDHQCHEVRYDLSDVEMVVITKNDAGVFTTERTVVDIDIELVDKQGIITSSFYEDGLRAGLTPRIIMEIAGVFAWDIDFVNSLQEGDSFAVIFEKKMRDGEFVGTRDIVAARFTTEGHDFYAYRILDDEGNPRYYNESGESVVRLLLKTPLNFKRISSGFSGSRKHPISGDWKSHRALDLTAAVGTPVETVGDGKVTFAGTKGGYGKYIMIDHGQGFKTAYAHLSKILVRQGQHVVQGDLIGAVGMTGTSTGPHLHYEMYKYGNPVHPFQTEVPRSPRLEESRMSELHTLQEQYHDRIAR